MAWLKKYIDKYTLMMITVIWNAIAIYIPIHFHWSSETIILIVTVGNAVIQWLSLETGNTKTSKKES
jgi:hypothetical protein